MIWTNILYFAAAITILVVGAVSFFNGFSVDFLVTVGISALLGVAFLFLVAGSTKKD